MKKELKGKCTNCGKLIEQRSNKNWGVYCNEPECQKVFMEIVMSKVNKK